VFMNEDGDRLALTKVKERNYHWDAFWSWLITLMLKI
jgi:hypothetical protein